MAQNHFRATFQKYFSPSATIEEIYYIARYLQLRNWDPIRDRFMTMPIKKIFLLSFFGNDLYVFLLANTKKQN